MYFISNVYSNYVSTLNAAFDIFDHVKTGDKQDRFDFVFNLKYSGKNFMGAALFSHDEHVNDGLTLLEYILGQQSLLFSNAELTGMDDWQIDLICKALDIPIDGRRQLRIDRILASANDIKKVAGWK